MCDFKNKIVQTFENHGIEIGKIESDTQVLLIYNKNQLADMFYIQELIIASKLPISAYKKLKFGKSEAMFVLDFKTKKVISKFAKFIETSWDAVSLVKYTCAEIKKLNLTRSKKCLIMYVCEHGGKIEIISKLPGNKVKGKYLITLAKGDIKEVMQEYLDEIRVSTDTVFLIDVKTLEKIEENYIS